MALMTKPNHLISLASSAILIDVRVRVWTGTKQDDEISEEVTTSKKADRDSGAFTKKLLANCIEHKRCLNYRQTVYNWKTRISYDWAGSLRMLPTIDLPRFMQQYQQHHDTFYANVDAFAAAYPHIVSNRAFTLGDMFDRNDYPTVEEVRSKFSIDLYRSEVPMGDYRVAIAQDIVDDLTASYERQAQQLVERILREQKTQLVDAMKTLAENCAVETVSENGELKVKRKKLYETALTRAQDLCNTFREFNVTGDADLENARSELARVLSGMTIEKLRDSDTARTVVHEELTDILSKFGV